jgi:integrase
VHLWQKGSYKTSSNGFKKETTMSTLVEKTKESRKWEIIINKGEERTRIYLGKMSKKTAEQIQSYVDRILDCNSAGQRLILILARYGGLRCPSELTGLKWSEID